MTLDMKSSILKCSGEQTCVNLFPEVEVLGEFFLEFSFRALVNFHQYKA